MGLDISSMQTNIYPSYKRFKTALVYGTIVVFTTSLFFLQKQAPLPYLFFFLSILLLELVTVVELFDFTTAIFAVAVGVLMESLTGNFMLAFGFIFLAAFYFFVRGLKKQRMQITMVREKHFRSLVNVSLQPMVIKNNKGQVMFASDSIKELLGVKKKNLVGASMEEFIHPEDRPQFKSFLTSVISHPNERKTIELRIKKFGDGYIWVRNDAINLLTHPDVSAIVGSWQDITFQKTADIQQSELLKKEREARTMAEKAVRDRDEFLSIASHELKTPLTTVLLQLQATLRKISTQSLSDFSGRDLLDSLQIAEKQSLSLSNLIKDLLNVSIASTGRLTLTKEKVNLTTLVDSLLNKYSEEIKISGCTIIVPTQKREIIGNWDPVRIEQALTNLLMNALKYAKGKHITIETELKDSSAIFIISDSGMGIPEDMMNRIFEPFQRANGDTSIKGLGVGLFITKQIVVSHGGTINVSSKIGKGTTFTMNLPLAVH